MVKYYVRWRHIPIERSMTPLMYISIDHTQVEAPEKATDFEIQTAIVASLPLLNLNPDDVRIESRQSIL
jgi:hypothetical protein